jgi:hypothetical protein
MKIALIGNCQVQSLAISAALMIAGVEIETFDYSQSYARDEERRKQFASTLKSFDYVFAQTALLSFTSEKDLRPILGDKLVTIANFYFRGLFPDSCYVGDYATRLEEPAAVNSLLVLDAFRRGLTEQAACQSFTLDAFERLGLLDAWHSSMAEMRKREANNVVDIPAADFMEDAARRYHSFLTMNHPTARLLTEYFGKVLDHVGIAHRVPAPGSYPDALADHDTNPIHDCIADYYHLHYRTLQFWRINSLGRSFTNREDYVAACYAAYRRADPATLVAHSPTDMVASLLNSTHRYLADNTVPTPESTPTPSAWPEQMQAPAISHRQISLALRPIAAKLDEVNTFVHKIHSFVQIMDPKVERIVQGLETYEHAQMVRPTPGEFQRLLHPTRVLIWVFLLMIVLQLVTILGVMFLVASKKAVLF